MSDLTIEVREVDGGYSLRRSDGKSFILRWTGGGDAVLYAAEDPSRLPIMGLVDFDSSIDDKLAASRRWVLAYPHRPPEIA